MWVWDGQGNPPSPEYLVNGPGCMCSDLVSFATMYNGLDPVYGTENLSYILQDQQPFDPSTPGVPGAICLRPYSGPALRDQGHVAIYVDEHTIIQALWTDGVTDAYTDAESWGWGGASEFTVYGFLPGVTYGVNEPVEDVPMWKKYGYWQYSSDDSWDLEYVPGS